MELIEGVLLLAACYLGYSMGQGKDLSINLKKFKPILRTEEEEAKLIDKLKRK